MAVNGKSKRLIVSTQLRNSDMKKIKELQKDIKVVRGGKRSAVLRALVRIGLHHQEVTDPQGSSASLQFFSKF